MKPETKQIIHEFITIILMIVIIWSMIDGIYLGQIKHQYSEATFNIVIAIAFFVILRERHFK